MTDPTAAEGPAPVILLVDDNSTNLQVLYKTLSGWGYKLLAAQNGASALQIAAKTPPDLVLLDLMMPGMNGYEVCRRLKADPATADTPVIFCSALDETDAKVRGFEQGAVDYVSKPYEDREVVARVQTHLTLRRLHRELIGRNAELEHELRVAEDLVGDAAARVEGALLGSSAAVKQLLADIAEAAATDAPVLLLGPPGAGQEAVARRIHHESARGRRAFIHANCVALGPDQTPALLGASRKLFGLGGPAVRGKWDLAGHGTLYLDRVGRLTSDTQSALAKRLAQNAKERSRGAAGSAIPRVIAYLARDADELSSASSAGEKLLRELGVHTIEVPALAERLEDLPALVAHYIEAKARRLDKPVERCGKRALKRLAKYRWPGNVDELSSVVECAVIASPGVELEIDEALLDVGERVGRYRLLERIGHGAMGEVWRGQHEMLRRPAAVKLVLAESGGKRRVDDKTIQRFEREARATAALESPNTVRLYDYGISDNGDLYYVMELLHGLDLDTMVEDHGPLSPARAVHFLAQACRSLSEAHAAGLVHRDIKPANLFAARLGPDLDVIKVLDFGIVRTDDAKDMNLTGASPVGSPAYMAPELIVNAPEFDGRADIYGLGCVGYWLLTGQFVFDATSVTAMCVAHATEEPKPPSALTDLPIPPELDDLMFRCLSKDPLRRPASADELWRRLTELDVGRPWGQTDAAAWWQAKVPHLLPKVAGS